MGAEVLDEGEMEVCQELEGAWRKISVVWLYGWGDGEWMRDG